MGGKGYALWLFIIEILVHFSTSRSAKVPSIIVFGDSSVDSGNNNFIPTIARSNFEPYGRDFFNGNPTGRFSNGRIAPDFISEAFGIKQSVPAYLDPAYNISDFASGVCFASAGTGFDNATARVAVSILISSSHSILRCIFLLWKNYKHTFISLLFPFHSIYFLCNSHLLLSIFFLISFILSLLTLSQSISF